MTPKVYAIHENPDWFPPFAAAFDAEDVPYDEWLLTGDGVLDLDAEPPEGVFWSRMSASSHTRGHEGGKDHARAVLSWLESHGRRTVNGRAVLELEMSKVAQHAALRAGGIDVPRTIAVAGTAALREQARRMPLPFISKHNQGGKGVGVHRFDSYGDFDDYLAAGSFEPAVDGVTLLQEYVEPREPFITRTEIVGGQHVYSLKASTAQGFELCPADVCSLDGFADGQAPASAPMFELRKDYVPPLLTSYLAFAAMHSIEIAAFEFIETREGRIVTYDVNTNTNYNPDVEAQASKSGPREIARLLSRLLREP